jgi:hypothetical protein
LSRNDDTISGKNVPVAENHPDVPGHHWEGLLP